METVETVLGLAIVIPWVVSWAFALYDIFLRRHDLSMIRRLVWTAIVVLLPAIGVVLYVLMRPPPRAEGKDGPDRDKAEPSVVDRLDVLVQEHDAGTVSDEDFAARKAALLGL